MRPHLPPPDEAGVGQLNHEKMALERKKQLSLIHKYPIVSFFVLASLLGTSIILLVFQGVIPAAFALSSVFSASVAGIIMIAILDGKSGLKLLLKRLLIWRVGIGYWLFATLFLIPVILLGSLFNSLINGDPVSFSNIKLTFNIVPMFIAFTIVTGLGQELGWTGFLLPRLQSRFGALVSSLLRTTLVILWHIPLLLYSRLQPYAIPDFPYGEWINEKGFWITLLAMVLLSLPWSIFFTWLFNNSQGSLLLVSILHGSEIWLVYLIGIGSKNLDNLWGYGLFMLISAIIMVIVTGPENLSRTHKKVVYQQIYR